MPIALWFKFPHFPCEHEWGFIMKIMNDLLTSCQTFCQKLFSKLKKIKDSNYEFLFKSPNSTSSMQPIM